jgi:uncharacterized protein
MKIFIAAFSAFVFVVASVRAQNPTGHYEGAVSRDGSVQLVKADFVTIDGKLTGTYDIPELMDFDVRIPPGEWKQDTLLLNLNYGNFFCRYFPSTDEITGISEDWRPKLRLHLKKIGSKEEHFTREEVIFPDKKIRLAGVIFRPNGSGPCPFVVLIHGSGNVDRNSAYYHSLGFTLAEHGIGVLLYDKRGCGKSEGNAASSTMWDLADDAAAALHCLRSNHDLNISKAGFMGTSQGGWIAAIAAKRSIDCDFAILNVGPSVSVYDQDLHRVKYSMMNDGWAKTAVDSAVEYTKLYFRYVKSSSTDDWEALNRYAGHVRTSEWASFVNLPDSEEDFAWWRMNNYDPADDLKKIHCPVLNILGEKDALVPPSENRAKMDSLLRLAKVPYSIKIIPGVGHDELTYQGLNGNDWKWPDVYWQWRKRPTVIIETIVQWVKSQQR